MAHPEPLTSHEHTSKRKRDSDDAGQLPHDRIPQPPPPQSGNGAHINYLARNPARMQLIQGDAEVFTDVLGLISDYEAVLNRQESLAANLGAKLTGPKLVNAMERLFEGPISLTQTDPRNAGPVTWLDIVQFSKASPSEFNLTTTDRGRVCTFYLNGNQVEITEDDWRMIVNGTLDRFNLAPSQPLDEDEDLELATVEILNERLQVLIKKADEVARKARQLNYHLSGRKAAINSRRTSTLSPATHHSSFVAHNQPQRAQASRSNSTYDLKSDLLRQFATTASPLARPGSARLNHVSLSMPSTPVIQQGQPNTSANTRPAIQPIHVSRGSPAASAEPQPPKSATKDDDDPSSIHRPLITARIEKLTKGDPITPPCDRCRRLRVQCIKHLTACQGCTRKHAKCGWKTVTDDEVAVLKGELPGLTEGEMEDASTGSRSGGGNSPDPQSASSVSAVEVRTFAPTNAAAQQHNMPNGTYVGIGGGGGGFGASIVDSSGSKERSLPEFGLRDTHRPGHRVDHSRLSHMASVALSSEAREQQQREQQLHTQNLIARGESLSGE
ncbi:hypothetical protein N0V93_009090 [Gnomoniopsis smithogilvyi]|uniref:Zn(2)-C6 fungal-type domain-containing protein n=1 Tax=Gnomoniopsis smithogilvyi TaxID=1191159 RepID=A0A9W8YMG6_9PEZI|nr:hypothetical protein N0V93_009090 [Gnomoniopsis smithogilvyi]